MKNLRKSLMFTLSVIMIFSLLCTGGTAMALSVAAPSEMTVSTTSYSVKLGWSKVSKASGYRVYMKVDGKWKALKTTSAVTYTAENLTASTNYTFGVKTYRKADGKTYWSSLKSVKAKTKAMPDIKTPKATSTANSITLKWTQVEGASGYRVYQYKNKKWVKIKSVTTNSYTVKSLKSATTYKFKIKPYAKTDSGTVWGDASKTVTVKTVDPTQTKITSAKATDTSVTLKWSKVSAATGYRVNVLEKGKWKRVKSTSSLSCKVTGLESNKEYTFMVRAYKKVDGKVTWYTESKSVKIATKVSENDLKPYRIAKYQEIFASDSLYVSISTNDPDLGTLPVEFAKKNGNLVMKATVENMETRIVYNQKKNKGYMIIDSLNMYAEMSPEDIKKMDMQEIINGMAINNVGEITVTNTNYNGKNAVCESYTDTVTGDRMCYYFIADVLVASERTSTSSSVEKMEFKKISTNVDDKLFDSPPRYYVNISGIAGM